MRYNDAHPTGLVAIKRVQKPKVASSLRPTPYASIQLANMLDVYIDGEELIFVHKAMDISLWQIAGASSL